MIKLRIREFIDLARVKFSDDTIIDRSGLTSHELNRLRTFKGKNLPLDLVGKLWRFLVEHRIEGWEDLPGGLFELEDPDLFSTLVRPKEVITVNGVRRMKGDGDFQSAQDSQLIGNLIHRLTIEGMQQVPVMDQVLVDTWPRCDDWNFDEISKNALAKYSSLQKNRRESLHVFVGTIKSNPAIEKVIAECFRNAIAFKSEDDVELPGDRSCPFYMCYREADKKPSSAISGTRLASTMPKSEPGFYYEDEQGIWQHLPCDRDHDAAVVFYRINEIKDTIDMVMGGFTAEATGYLAEYLRTAKKTTFWPPTYTDINQQIGLFMVKFTGRNAESRDTEVIPVSRGIESRVIKIRAYNRVAK